MGQVPKRELQGPRAVVGFIARSGKRIGITILGFLLLVAGIVMMVTPGPGVAGIIAGLAVLASEYAWAERMLDTVKEKAGQARNSIFRRSKKPPAA